jgi:tRNA modification GTPase
MAKHTGKAVPQQPGIFALATPPGRSAIAVLRLSGQGVRKAVERMAGKLPVPRSAELVAVADRPGGETIDHGLLLWFPSPHSYTGEDLAEFHLHGGRATVAAAVDALVTHGLRPAEAGEFTRRAFRNGKVDLTQAEAIADLIDAETSAQRRQALSQMQGALSKRIEGWRDRLIAVMALVEAVLDFSDEPLPDGVEGQADAEISLLRRDISKFLGRQGPAERLRDGVRIAILGPPNAGKSSLLNALACRDAAIVSTTAGTTRDVIEVHLDLEGVPSVIADTAGLREETVDAIEAEGVRRATAWGRAADLKLLVGGADDWPAMETQAIREIVDERTIVVGNKIDLGPVPVRWRGHEVSAVSVLTGAGTESLLRRLAAMVREIAGEGEPGSITRARHRQGLATCVDALDRFLLEEETELRAEELRVAAQALGRLTGRIDVEDVLDALFRTFCIGK